MIDALENYKSNMYSDNAKQIRALAEPYIKLHKADAVIFMDWVCNGIGERYTMQTNTELREFMSDLNNLVIENIAQCDKLSGQEREDLVLVTALMQGSGMIIIDFLLAHYPEYAWQNEMIDTVYGALHMEANNGRY